ncbi:MAG: 2-hydroxy-6-oxonona-2,4-dienedioate hydrolase, partial [Parvicella sp.]
MRFKYLRKGKGPVLVLQHGFLTSATYWHKQFDAFAQHFDVIALTSPGYAGNSEQEVIDSIKGFSEHLLRLVDHANVKRFNLIGHSMGGMIAQETALQAGDRINKLVLYGTGPNG